MRRTRLLCVDPHEVDDLRERILSKCVDISGHLAWCGRMHHGSAILVHRGRVTAVTRLAWTLARGSDIPGYLLRECDEPRCVSPGHHRARHDPLLALREARRRWERRQAERRRHERAASEAAAGLAVARLLAAHGIDISRVSTANVVSADHHVSSHDLRPSSALERAEDVVGG